VNDSSLTRTLDSWWFRIRFRVSGFVGRLLNMAGLPGFVRDAQTYEFAGLVVRTSVGPWCMRISVGGVELEFSRLTGRIDGIAVCSPSQELLKSLSRTTAPSGDSQV